MKKLFSILLMSLLFAGGLYAQKSSNIKIEELNSKTFKEKVWNFDKYQNFTYTGKTPVILDFFATWCPPCKRLAPHLQAIQNKYKKKLTIYEIDVDQQQDLARMFNVQAMPTLIFINSKSTYKTNLGYLDFDDLDAMVKAYFFKK